MSHPFAFACLPLAIVLYRCSATAQTPSVKVHTGYDTLYIFDHYYEERFAGREDRMAFGISPVRITVNEVQTFTLNAQAQYTVLKKVRRNLRWAGLRIIKPRHSPLMLRIEACLVYKGPWKKTTIIPVDTLLRLDTIPSQGNAYVPQITWKDRTLLADYPVRVEYTNELRPFRTRPNGKEVKLSLAFEEAVQQIYYTETNAVQTKTIRSGLP